MRSPQIAAGSTGAGRGNCKKGRRSWDGGPSGLLLKTPGQAEREVGRSLNPGNLVGAYHFTVNERTIKGALRSSFFPLSSFLFFLIGFAVGFMPSSPRLNLALRHYLLQSPRQRLAPLHSMKIGHLKLALNAESPQSPVS